MTDTAERRDVVTLEPKRSQAVTPLEMLNAAVERGDAIEKLEKLMDLNDRWEAAQAKKAFIEAKAEFKANAPTIIKDMENKQYKSMYSSIGNVVNGVNAALSHYGLDACWDFDQTESGIKVTCILTHCQGHSERVSLSGPPDNSGQKNPIQQIKSTTTYLKLATFEAVTGIASREGNKDDDGNAASAQPISDDQANELISLADSVEADKAAFCKYLSMKFKREIKGFAQIPANKFEDAKKALQKKGQAQ